MKKSLTLLFGSYVCLFIYYSVHDEERLTANSTAKSFANKVTGQTIAQDSVQTENELNDSSKFIFKKGFSHDISAGDIFIGFE